MISIKALEFKDLDKATAERVSSEFLNYQVEADLNALWEDVEGGLITEAEAYKNIGCSKSYAETTAWFVGACYYEHNKEQVDADVMGTLETALFNKAGVFIGHKESNE